MCMRVRACVEDLRLGEDIEFVDEEEVAPARICRHPRMRTRCATSRHARVFMCTVMTEPAMMLCSS